MLALKKSYTFATYDLLNMLLKLDIRNVEASFGIGSSPIHLGVVNHYTDSVRRYRRILHE